MFSIQNYSGTRLLRQALTLPPHLVDFPFPPLVCPFPPLLPWSPLVYLVQLPFRLSHHHPLHPPCRPHQPSWRNRQRFSWSHQTKRRMSERQQWWSPSQSQFPRRRKLQSDGNLPSLQTSSQTPPYQTTTQTRTLRHLLSAPYQHPRRSVQNLVLSRDATRGPLPRITPLSEEVAVPHHQGLLLLLHPCHFQLHLPPHLITVVRWKGPRWMSLPICTYQRIPTMMKRRRCQKLQLRNLPLLRTPSRRTQSKVGYLGQCSQRYWKQWITFYCWDDLIYTCGDLWSDLVKIGSHLLNWPQVLNQY